MPYHLATPPSEGPRVGQPWPASQGRLYVAWASKFRRFGPEGSRGLIAPPGQEGNSLGLGQWSIATATS